MREEKGELHCKVMADEKSGLRSSTEVLTRGFDPRLSVGSARPAVFRSSTYVFSSPEAAERAFDLVAGRAKPQPGEQPDLIYSRFNHPNAEIFESQIVPLENGARAALVFNSGMAAITTALFTFLRPGDAILYTVPIYGGTQSLIEGFLESWGVSGIAVASRRHRRDRGSHSHDSQPARGPDRDARESHADHDRYPAARLDGRFSTLRRAALAHGR